MKKLIILISSILFITCLAFSEDLSEYVNVINEKLIDGCKNSTNVIQGWKDGVKVQFGCDLDHLTSTFILLKYRRIEDEKIILAGTVTTIGYAYKDNLPVRIVQVNTVVYLMNKDKMIEDWTILDFGIPKVIDGWVGTIT